MSKSEGDYQKNLSVFEDKYANDLSVMFEYFDNEWIQGVFLFYISNHLLIFRLVEQVNQFISFHLIFI